MVLGLGFRVWGCGFWGGLAVKGLVSIQDELGLVPGLGLGSLRCGLRQV